MNIKSVNRSADVRRRGKWISLHATPSSRYIIQANHPIGGNVHSIDTISKIWLITRIKMSGIQMSQKVLVLLTRMCLKDLIRITATIEKMEINFYYHPIYDIFLRSSHEEERNKYGKADSYFYDYCLYPAESHTVVKATQESLYRKLTSHFRQLRLSKRIYPFCSSIARSKGITNLHLPLPDGKVTYLMLKLLKAIFLYYWAFMWWKSIDWC